MQPLELVNTFVEETEGADLGNNGAIVCLGCAIMKLGTADYYAGLRTPTYYNGCVVENEVAVLYNIPRMFYPFTEEIFPDLWEDHKKDYRSKF